MMNDEGQITNYKPQITNKVQKANEQNCESGSRGLGSGISFEKNL
jgi:hypothetical protein